MNLHEMVAGVVAAVNPPVAGTWARSTGYSTSGSGKRTPTYATAVALDMQVQALSGPELALVDGLNIQGIKRAVYLPGNVEGANRPDGKGGDVLTFLGKTWLVLMVLETWDSGNWCKVAVAEQLA